MVTPGFYPIRDGTETVVRNLSVELNRIGVETDIIAFNMDRKWNPQWRGRVEHIDGLSVFKIPALNWLPTHSPRINFHVNLLPGLFTNLLGEYDIIHFHEVDFSFPLFSFFVRKPKILHVHGIHVNYFKRYHLSRIILKNVADFYICITKKMVSDLQDLGIPQHRIIYIPNAVDGSLFHPRGAREENLLVYLGRIVSDKGLHVLLAALRHLDESVRLVIAGPGVDAEYLQ